MLGYALMAAGTNIDYLYWGLATVAVGNGFFQPNIAAAVGELYADTDVRREAAFIIFFAAINLGAISPPFFIGGLVSKAW